MLITKAVNTNHCPYVHPEVNPESLPSQASAKGVCPSLPDILVP